MELRRFLWLLSLGVIIVAAIAIWAYPSPDDFSQGNPSWNGLSAFVTQLSATPLTSLQDLPSAARGTVLMLIPYLQPTHEDLEKLKDYLGQGGALIVLDDYGYGNDILDYLGLTARFSSQQLLDPVLNYKNKYLPKVDVVDSEQKLVLNHASSLTHVSGTEVIAWSSPFSFLDLDSNSEWNEGESSGPFPIAARLKSGNGNIVLLADPSLIINSMIGMEDNLRFIQGCVQIQTSQPRILIDQSHLPRSSLDRAKDMLDIAHQSLSSPWGILILVMAILIVTLRPVWRRQS